LTLLRFGIHNVTHLAISITLSAMLPLAVIIAKMEFFQGTNRYLNHPMTVVHNNAFLTNYIGKVIFNRLTHLLLVALPVYFTFAVQ
jgi:hypothetical protein